MLTAALFAVPGSAAVAGGGTTGRSHGDFGASYGTYIGTVYGNLFPGNTRVLDSTA